MKRQLTIDEIKKAVESNHTSDEQYLKNYTMFALLDYNGYAHDDISKHVHFDENIDDVRFSIQKAMQYKSGHLYAKIRLALNCCYWNYFGILNE